MSVLPPSRPRLTDTEARAILAAHGVHASKEVAVLAKRGYYLDTMGVKGKNDRGIYDDAIAIVGPEVFAAFNGNTDPSVYRPGIATLVPGVHVYKPGLHGVSFNKPGYPYPAFVPATPGKRVPVMRDGESKPSVGVAINIHRGSRTTTSSLGCQTIPPDQWDAFHALLTSQLKRMGQTTFHYVLVA
jgi:lysozyme